MWWDFLVFCSCWTNTEITKMLITKYNPLRVWQTSDWDWLSLSCQVSFTCKDAMCKQILVSELALYFQIFLAATQHCRCQAEYLDVHFDFLLGSSYANLLTGQLGKKGWRYLCSTQLHSHRIVNKKRISVYSYPMSKWSIAYAITPLHFSFYPFSTNSFPLFSRRL